MERASMAPVIGPQGPVTGTTMRAPAGRRFVKKLKQWKS